MESRNDNMNALIALLPNTRNGCVQRRHPRISTIQKQIARMTIAKPAVKITNVLVHKFLLIGKRGCSRRPTIIVITPTIISPANFRSFVFVLRIHSPVSTPHRTVPIAGNVLRIPSGSRTCFNWPHKCPYITRRSSHAARLFAGSKFAGPMPGTGISRIAADGTLVYDGAIDDRPQPFGDPRTAKNYVRAAVNELVAGKPVTVVQTKHYGCGVHYAN